MPESTRSNVTMITTLPINAQNRTGILRFVENQALCRGQNRLAAWGQNRLALTGKFINQIFSQILTAKNKGPEKSSPTP